MRARISRAVGVSLALTLLLGTSVGVVSAKDGIGSVTATPKSLAFGKVAVGTASTLTFWITNNTKAPLLMTSLAAGNNGGFSYLSSATTNDCFGYVATGTLLSPGESCGNAVSFQPASPGRQSSSMSFTFSDGVRTLGLTEAFTGTGT
jgi:hypothetical protein